MNKNYFIHATAEVSQSAAIGKGTKIWNYAQIRENVTIGDNCIISKNVYIDFNVIIGDNVKIQNNCSVYHGCKVENGVFLGPHVCVTNDKIPRAINPDGTPKSNKDWQVGETLIREGASIGACSVILPGVTVGKFALVGAGSVVTKNIPDHALVFGNPAIIKGYVCYCGSKLNEKNECTQCKIQVKLS